MKSFKRFLIEMSIIDARKVFGFKTKFTEKELKSKYRKLSSENHPDKGGSTEVMQSINVAYELLKKGTSSINSDGNEGDWHKKWNDTAVIIRDDLIKNLDIDAYTDYFEGIFKEPFKSEVVNIYPSDAEIKQMNSGFRPQSVHNVFYDVSFSNKDNTKVFQLGLSVYIADLMKTSKGLGASDTTYPMGVHTFAYIDSRKVKITSRDYTNTTKKNVFVKPATVFPKSKIVNKKKPAFKKASMLSALKAEIQADRSGDFYYVPTGEENKFIGINRMTMMGSALWSINGLFEKNERGRYVKIKDNDKIRFMSFTETEDFLDILRKVKTYSLKDSIKLLNTEYQKLLKGSK